MADVDGPITPVVADHVASVVGTAEGEGHAAVAIRLDTPGGLDTSMRVQPVLASSAWSTP